MAWSVFGRRFDSVGAKWLGRNQKARPRRLQPGVDGLESRNLLTGGGGASLSNGMLSIIAPLNSGNTASVSLDAAHNNVHVTLNGTGYDFAANQVTAIYYQGGINGHDTFVNSTNILSIDYGFGGGNNFTGGTGADYMFVWGDGNTLHDDGGGAVVFTHSGHDIIDAGILSF